MKKKNEERAARRKARWALGACADKCAICLDRLERNGFATHLVCSHRLHKACFRALCERGHSACPTCRTPLYASDGSGVRQSSVVACERTLVRYWRSIGLGVPENGRFPNVLCHEKNPKTNLREVINYMAPDIATETFLRTAVVTSLFIIG